MRKQSDRFMLGYMKLLSFMAKLKFNKRVFFLSLLKEGKIDKDRD